jgi:hypothetical protein
VSNRDPYSDRQSRRRFRGTGTHFLSKSPSLLIAGLPCLFHSDPTEHDRLRFDGGCILNAKTS